MISFGTLRFALIRKEITEKCQKITVRLTVGLEKKNCRNGRTGCGTVGGIDSDLLL